MVLLLLMHLTVWEGFIWRPVLSCSQFFTHPLGLWPPLSPPVYSRNSHLVGEVSTEVKPLEMPGWDFIRSGAPGDECPGQGAVGNTEHWPLRLLLLVGTWRESVKFLFLEGE